MSRKKEFTDNELALLKELYGNRSKAASNRAEWQKYERELTARIHQVCGTDSDDAKSTSVPGVLYVKIVPVYGLDGKRLKEERPDVYAEYETLSSKRYINEPMK